MTATEMTKSLSYAPICNDRQSPKKRFDETASTMKIISKKPTQTAKKQDSITLLGKANYPLVITPRGGTVAEWLACWTQAEKGVGSNRSREAVG